MEIIWSASVDEVRTLTARGYEPVECALGCESIVGPLQMDHHGRLSHLEGVALRAYRDHFGSRREAARFVVTGTADADATFAIASLAGVLPHPSQARFFEHATPRIQAAMARDLSAFAVLVNQADMEPLGLGLAATPEGRTLLLWNQMASDVQDATAFHAGVDRWRALLCGTERRALVAAAATQESERVEEARRASVDRLTAQVALVESGGRAFDVWYAEIAPVIVLYNEANSNVTVGCPGKEAAERIFGHGGLLQVFPLLSPPGWGGREGIGGSPRGVRLTRAQAREAAVRIAQAATNP